MAVNDLVYIRAITIYVSFNMYLDESNFPLQDIHT